MQVLEPLELRDVRIKNRIVSASHGTGLGTLRGGIGRELIAYHVARARGGVGLIILETASVHHTAAPPPRRLRSWDDGIVPEYQELMAAVAPHDTRVFQQLVHGGQHMGPEDGSQPWGASTVPSVHLSRVPLEMSKAQIEEITGAFVQAAQRAEKGGLDGVEIHAAHGFLLNQFLSPATNHRDDEYGGSLAGRMRFLLEVVAAVRANTAEGFAVGVRLSAVEGIPDAQTVEESVAIARALEGSGHIDFLDVSLGGFFRGDIMVGAMHEPHGYELSRSLPVARATKLPTIVSGRIKSLEEANAIVAADDAQLVSMVRAQIADPDLVRKSVSGRAREVRPCIACNQVCLVGWFPGGPIGCTVNPDAGLEWMSEDADAPDAGARKRVAVIGGGPAGHGSRPDGRGARPRRRAPRGRRLPWRAAGLRPPSAVSRGDRRHRRLPGG